MIVPVGRKLANARRLRFVDDLEEPLTCLSSYGRRAGSTRVRVFDWLDLTGVSAVTPGYLDLGMGSARDLRGHPVAVVGAERATRSLTNARLGRLLLHLSLIHI